ncbi:hotdog fold thioesterase [Escherichia coli]|nr:hotdog fold thioesterase [Escherichia coli]EFF0640420.1 hotdog fold thioesterase [Escherichia coli]EFH9407534.1 hotdog fold thioesterase [Escherichia coli]EFL9454806.1 hotdog fold thioesterase [Escherichia coli]EFN4709724.1 hotdog fold thioesterase [Escherichia coli]
MSHKAWQNAHAMYENDACAKALGIDIISMDEGFAVVTMTVTAQMLNGHQSCHGGQLFSLADTAFAYACNMHGFPEQDTVVEEDGHIGHSAILHGCIIRRNALVGMNAVVMDGAVIGENSIVGASAFVKAKAEMPANYLIVGSPAKAIRELSEQELAWKKQGTHEYQVLVTRCKQTLHQVEPLREVEPNRKRLVFDENLRPKQ